MNSSYSKTDCEFKEYVDRYGLENILTDLMNATLYEKSENPVLFMVKYLISLLNESELKDNGITLGTYKDKEVNIIDEFKANVPNNINESEMSPRFNSPNEESDLEEESLADTLKARYHSSEYEKNREFLVKINSVDSEESSEIGGPTSTNSISSD